MSMQSEGRLQDGCTLSSPAAEPLMELASLALKGSSQGWSQGVFTGVWSQGVFTGVASRGEVAYPLSELALDPTHAG